MSLGHKRRRPLYLQLLVDVGESSALVHQSIRTGKTTVATSQTKLQFSSAIRNPLGKMHVALVVGQ